VSTPPTDDKVGYRRPPPRTRWRKGQCGNPQGSKRKIAETTVAMIDRLMLTTVPITLNGRRKRVAALEAILYQLLQKAMGGERRAYRAHFRNSRSSLTKIRKRNSSSRLSRASTPARWPISLPAATMPDYEIGYRKPPKKTRFKPGVSGNPKGRPKCGPSTMAKIIHNVMNAPIEYREKGRIKAASRHELSIKILVERAVKGDIAAAEHLLRVRAHGEVGSDRLRICDWLPDFPGQTADQKTKDFAGTTAVEPLEWWHSVQLTLRRSVSSTSVTVTTPGAGCSITSTAMVSTAGVTGLISYQCVRGVPNRRSIIIMAKRKKQSSKVQKRKGAKARPKAKKLSKAARGKAAGKGAVARAKPKRAPVKKATRKRQPPESLQPTLWVINRRSQRVGTTVRFGPTPYRSLRGRW
jgi:Family of unknown function (DUF5681)